MKNSKKFLSTLIALSMLGSAAFADIPKGSVIIGDKAYNLKYANDQKNLKEIIDQIVGNQSDIYIKWHDGKLYENSGNETTEDFIPSVTYKDSEGNLTDYDAEDGEEIILNVTHASFINANQVKIKFNKKVLYESAVYKQNYKIGGKTLGDGDNISLQADDQTIIITLNEKLDEENFESNICVSENLLDSNNNKMDMRFNRNILVINNSKSSVEKEINKDVNIITSNYSLNNVKVNGNIYVNADNVTVKSTEVSENIILDPGKEGNSSISNVKSDKVVILSGGENSINLSNVASNLLHLTNNSKVRVISKGGTKISSTLIKNNAVLDSVSGSFGEITVDIMSNTNDREVELKGRYKEPVVLKRGVKLIASNNSFIPELKIAPNHKDKDIVIQGRFQNVEVIKQSIVTLAENSIVKQLIAKADVTLDGAKRAKIEKLFADEDVNVKVNQSDENGELTIPDVRPIGEIETEPSTPWIPSTPVDKEYKPTASKVTATGTLKVGDTLTGSYKYSDKDGDKEGDSTFKWYRADDASGTNKTEISNANDISYTLTSNDEGKYISFEVTPVSKTGNKTGITVMSDFVGPIEADEVIVKDTEKPVITLNGESRVVLYGGQVYKDAGATAVDNVDGDISTKIKVKITDEDGNEIQSIDTSKVGTYTIHYNVIDEAGNKADEVTRIVIVKEKIIEENVVNVYVDGQNVTIIVESEFIKEDVSIKIVDAESSEVAFIDQIKSENNKVVFNATVEKAGLYIAYINAIEDLEIIEKSFVVEDEIVEDTEIPVITLSGQSRVVLYGPQVYEDAGVTAVDNMDGDISSRVEVTITDESGNEFKSIDTSKVGTYTVHYNVTDEAGNEAYEVTRTVIVREAIIAENVMDIKVDGPNVAITVESPYIKEDVSIKIVDAESNEVAFIDQLKSENNKVVFNTTLEKGRQYIAYVNAIEDYKGIERAFAIEGETDLEMPVITLNGEYRIVLYGSQEYMDAGASAVDNIDGDISDRIQTTITDESGNEFISIDTSKVGTYTIHYNVTDEAGNEAYELTRTVIVREAIIAENVIDIKVDEQNAAITVESPYIKEEVSIKIVHSETKELVYVNQCKSENNKVIFNTTFDESGKYTVIINAIEDYKNLEKEFTFALDDIVIIGMSDDHTVKITVESPDLYEKVTLRIVNVDNEKIYYLGEKKTVDDIVEFIAKLLDDGEYKVFINAYGPGEEIIEKTIIIGEEIN